MATLARVDKGIFMDGTFLTVHQFIDCLCCDVQCDAIRHMISQNSLMDASFITINENVNITCLETIAVEKRMIDRIKGNRK